MTTVNIHQAKTNLSKLLDIVLHGEEVIIAKAGKPVARLIPILEAVPERVPGALKGKIKISKDFDSPLFQNITDDFDGSYR